MGVSMRRTRARRRSFLDLSQIQIGDYIILISAALAVVSLFLPWLVTNTPGSHNEWAFTYSDIAAVIVIVFFLATLFLVVYPALSPDLNLPLLPISTPLLFFLMGGIMLVISVFELGKYDCIECQGLVSRGFGVYVLIIASILYLIGAVIKWGSRPSARRTERW